MADQYKYLIRMLLKGKKGDFSCLVAWLQEIYTDFEFIQSLIEKNRNDAVVLATVLKFGMISDSEDVVRWTLKNLE